MLKAVFARLDEIVACASYDRGEVAYNSFKGSRSLSAAFSVLGDAESIEVVCATWWWQNRGSTAIGSGRR